VYAAKHSGSGAPYYWAKRQLEHLLAEFHSRHLVQLEPLQGADLYNNPWLEQMTAPFEPNRSAVLRDEQGLIWGVVGEFKASVRRSLKLPAQTAGFEIDPLLLLQATPDGGYVPLSRFPKVIQDITLKVPLAVTHQALIDFFWQEYKAQELKNVEATLSPLDIYQAKDDADHKNVTLHLTVVSYERTLTDSEVNKLLDAVAEAAHQQWGAQRI
jgi:phenylalanyl-tRNA synthetase beta subunit